jgi:hypothetical protein
MTRFADAAPKAPIINEKEIALNRVVVNIVVFHL